MLRMAHAVLLQLDVTEVYGNLQNLTKELAIPTQVNTTTTM